MAKRKPKKVVAQAPYLLAMVVCDAIHQDQATRKYTLLGTFSAVAATQFPAVHPRFALYLAITDGRGKVPFKLRFVDVDEEREPVFLVEGEVQFGDPRAIVEMSFNFANVTFPAAGEYRVIFEAGGEFVMERRILVHQIGEGPL